MFRSHFHCCVKLSTHEVKKISRSKKTDWIWELCYKRSPLFWYSTINCNWYYCKVEAFAKSAVCSYAPKVPGFESNFWAFLAALALSGYSNLISQTSRKFLSHFFTHFEIVFIIVKTKSVTVASSYFFWVYYIPQPLYTCLNFPRIKVVRICICCCYLAQ